MVQAWIGGPPPIPFKRVEQFPGPESYAKISPNVIMSIISSKWPSIEVEVEHLAPWPIDEESQRPPVARLARSCVCHVRWVMATNSSQMPLYPVSCFCEKVFTLCRLCLRISSQNHCFGW